MNPPRPLKKIARINPHTQNWPRTADRRAISLVPETGATDAVLHGLCPLGRQHDVTLFAASFTFVGDIYAVRDGAVVLAERTPDATLSTTVPEPTKVVSLFATDARTRKLVRLVGRLKPAEARAVPPASSDSQPTISRAPSAPASDGAPTNPRDAKTKVRKRADETADRAAFCAELERVQAEKAAGIESMVTLQFLAEFAKCSRATLYRDQAKGLFDIVRVGGRSRVRFSDCEAYVSGAAHRRSVENAASTDRATVAKSAQEGGGEATV